MNLSEQPVFALTCDVDWASEYCIESFLATAGRFDITPTVFVTHRSRALQESATREHAQLGIHPRTAEPTAAPGNASHLLEQPAFISRTTRLVALCRP